MSYFNTQQRGFTLILAALVASLLTSLGLAMFSIAKKEIILSSLGRDSQLAFYAADTGAECALYWNFRHGAFATSTVFSSPGITPTCAGNVLQDFPTPYEPGIPDGVSGLGGNNYSTFWFEPEGRCVYVTVTKRTTHPHTVVESLGYSTPCSEPDHPRRLERAVRSTF
ncbi:hypothetical protein JXR01_03440 [Candidatus Kaiserbacteria bacterium]|nr:MAG: hypothetical protein JXR01_03440 [Candidatus Kaiserbacteria bacterium]